ncbi:DUF4270 family protein [Epilithonimonas zeae]|uniref:DUF4270 family protein n=1 Tax=Epilithonimonas zeae TaxID=1416779 RepID=UPI00200C052A|nr:DUF4270 family protein [Epilithonimonas zeae]
MIKIKTLMKLLPFLLMGVIVLNSCEGDLDDLGSQLVEGADGADQAYSIIAYNINNNDVIQSDASKLDSVRIGNFEEDVFGSQKVSYLTQLRLDTYNPDFGKNPVIDSVVLTLKPRYATATDSITTTTNEDYVYPDGSVAAKKVVTTYPVSKYGRTKNGKDKLIVNIKVNEVTDFMGGASDSLSSNKAFAIGSQIGSKSFNGTVNSVVITKDSDGSELLNRSVSMRIKLDSAFFQNKIIAKQGNQVLKDAASFIRYFKGISISVDEPKGYLFSMAPNDAGIVIYYKNDVTATDGTVTRTKAQTTLNLGSGNTHFSHIVFNKSSDYSNAMTAATNVKDLDNPLVPQYTVNPASKIYMQGMGGSSIGLRIPAGTILALKKLYKENKVGIVSAKLRLFNDDITWKNSYRKPSSLIVRQNNETGFLPDMTELASAGYSLIKTANLSTENASYDIGITASLKKIIEDETYDVTKGKDFIVNVGSYLSDASTGLLLGQAYNDRAYNPYRIVLKGTDINNLGNAGEKILNTSKVAQLRIIYTKK